MNFNFNNVSISGEDTALCEKTPFYFHYSVKIPNLNNSHNKFSDRFLTSVFILLYPNEICENKRATYTGHYHNNNIHKQKVI